MPTAGLLIIGNEILSGKVTDENSPYFCRELRSLGVDVERILTIPDDVDVIARELRAMADADVDAILCPPFALPALTHGSSVDLFAASSYTIPFNVTGLPAGVVPITTVQPGEESDRTVTRDKTDIVAQTVERGSAGLPVGVQVVARHWREDIVLSVMAALESEVG